jgi:flagellar protein FliO/FliZ
VRVDRPQRRLRPALLACAAVLGCALADPGTVLGDSFKRDRTPLPAGVGDASDPAPVHTGGGSYLRLLVGLAIVVALIFGIYRLLKRANRGALGGPVSGLAIVATTALGPNRAVHLVRVGPELVLVGSAEHAVTKLRVYDADEAAELLATLDGAAAFTPVSVSSALDVLRRRTARR